MESVKAAATFATSNLTRPVRLGVEGEEDRGGGEERREAGKEGCCVAGTPARRDRA